jgi:magnesium transporter
MIRSYLCKNNKVIRNIPLPKLKRYLNDKKAIMWVDLQKATEEEYKQLEETFKFHPLSMEDAQKSIELPKVEVFDDYIFVVLYNFSLEHEKKYPIKKEIDFFLGKNFLVTVHEHQSESIERLAIRLEKAKNGKARTADFLMYEITDHMVDQYFPIVDHWEDYIEDLESNIITHNPAKTALQEITTIKRNVLFFKRSISPQREVINRLARREFPFVRELAGVYFRDVYDHVIRIYTELEIQRDLINNAFEAYMSVLTIKMTRVSNKMNEVMQKLTVIATIFMPLTFLAGVYGMNFRYFPEIYWKYGYLFFWIAVVIIGLVMFFFFKRKKWA